MDNVVSRRFGSLLLRASHRASKGALMRPHHPRGMRTAAREQLKDLGIGTIQDITQKVETLSGQVLALIKRLRTRGLPVVLISHNMPHVFEVADRIHIQRLGRCAGVITLASQTMEEAVAIMTGAT